MFATADTQDAPLDTTSECGLRERGNGGPLARARSHARAIADARTAVPDEVVDLGVAADTPMYAELRRGLDALRTVHATGAGADGTSRAAKVLQLIEVGTGGGGGGLSTAHTRAHTHSRARACSWRSSTFASSPSSSPL